MYIVIRKIIKILKTTTQNKLGRGDGNTYKCGKKKVYELR